MSTGYPERTGRSSRRAFLAGAAATLVAGPSMADPSAVVMRRAALPGEDPDWLAYALSGPYRPDSTVSVVPVGNMEVAMFHSSLAPVSKVVLFSHGAMSTPTAYAPVLRHLASHGFLVLAPLHDDNPFRNGLTRLRARPDGTIVWDVSSILEDQDAWDRRARDLVETLDHADELGASVGLRVDAATPLVMGHEFGAYTAGLCAGVRARTADGVLSSKDGRIVGAILMGMFGHGIMGLVEGSFAGLDVPTLVVQAGLDVDHTGQSPAEKVEAFRAAPAGWKHLAWFPEGKRTLYSARGTGSSVRERRFEDYVAMLTMFARAYGWRSDAAARRIGSDWPVRASDRRFAAASR